MVRSIGARGRRTWSPKTKSPSAGSEGRGSTHDRANRALKPSDLDGGRASAFAWIVRAGGSWRPQDGPKHILVSGGYCQVHSHDDLPLFLTASVPAGGGWVTIFAIANYSQEG